MNIAIVILITIIPAVAWFFLWRSMDKEKEPFRAMLWCFILGILATVPFYVLRTFFPELVNSLDQTFSLYFFAFFEEIFKAMMLIMAIEISSKYFSQIVDGLIYGSALALGFAFAENVYYLYEFLAFDFSFLMIYLVRSMNTMVAHTMFTALFGFFYASAYLRDDIFRSSGRRGKPWHYFRKHIWQSLPLHVTIFHILPNRPSKQGHFPGSLILEGIIVASLLHVLFNYLLRVEIGGVNIGFLTYPLIFGLGYLVWRMFLQKIYVKVVHHVKRK